VGRQGMGRRGRGGRIRGCGRGVAGAGGGWML